ncbi:hypothetical protein PC129_g12549 [Phytophthora cactorum]|uniref:RxLR effector protein n=1 Tax=Phytophthora cactorum TaxID=29920 RepID=A0A329S2S9_9STRA|nr:hypothetical protein Pcac1_g16844 [Phytophthora cactorum]KAG2805792.1 hypothetical protein PC111_g17660 [Phytophthora cactorum]KAG2853037.1 hypothetical protein PC113_g14511 [Phytophthora cactorum]KAG2894722.1 hypothetical protein PC115_g18060 [Phytophthora cactorum]KAG2895505.1 hypothetical protein PC114_g15454 [Phytophthora cactorum]
MRVYLMLLIATILTSSQAITATTGGSITLIPTDT